MKYNCIYQCTLNGEKVDMPIFENQYLLSNDGSDIIEKLTEAKAQYLVKANQLDKIQFVKENKGLEKLEENKTKVEQQTKSKDVERRKAEEVK